MSRPLGYHITWGTYGTRLHGDPRATVDRAQKSYGAPVLSLDTIRWEKEKARLRFSPIYLTLEQRQFIEAKTPGICARGHWTFHAIAGASDHVHLIVASETDPQTIRQMFKRWLGQEMGGRWPLPDGATWWAESGSVRWLMEQPYFMAACDYVNRQRADACSRP